MLAVSMSVAEEVAEAGSRTGTEGWPDWEELPGLCLTQG